MIVFNIIMAIMIIGCLFNYYRFKFQVPTIPEYAETEMYVVIRMVLTVIVVNLLRYVVGPIF